MYYVYIIQSINFPDQIYVGCTEDFKKRLSNHNAGTTPHTAKYKPWKFVTYIAFKDKFKAYEFEEFLKSGSGRAFRDKRILCLPKNTNQPGISSEDLKKFIDLIVMRFGVYLDTIWGFQNNLEKINDVQSQTMEKYRISRETLDQVDFHYGNERPPIEIKLINEKSLHKRTQGQLKIDNGVGGVNNTFAIYNCLSDIYNQWKIIIHNDKDIPVIDYIRQLRNRTQHELYDDKGFIKANDPIEMKKNLSGYPFPIFHEGDNIILTHKDCIALIQEIRLQLNEFLLSK